LDAAGGMSTDKLHRKVIGEGENEEGWKREDSLERFKGLFDVSYD